MKRLEGPESAGTAGCLRDSRAAFGSEPLLVVYRNLVPHDLDLAPLLDAPLEEGTPLWAAVAPAARRSTREVSLDGEVVRGFAHLHFSQDRRQGARPLGVFLCVPRVLDHVPESGYFDLEEQLVPAIQATGSEVRAVIRASRALRIEDAGDYLSALSESLHAREPAPGDNEIGRGVWTRGEVEVSRSATLLGPLVIDQGAVIEEGAVIVGPAYVGEGVTVGRGARVHQASLWAGSRVEAGAEVGFSVVAERQRVGPGETLSYVVRSGHDEALGRPATLYGTGPALPAAWGRAAESPFYPLQKRLLDILVAGVALIGTLPLWALIALAIKIEGGPVFFRHRRCGRFGVEFPMLKFRTMHHEALVPRADSERKGPIYKHSADPRISRVGTWLRWSSLDELPQLWNILRGDMSLVGPRPLEADEMLYNPQWRDLRLSVKPGLTGLWQLHARRSTDFESWIHYDTEYVLSPGSIRRDLRILFDTARGLLKGELFGE
jgi:lipopolysaccharide/colanic/teichoic acid biosynthesis glycosyltransferase